MELKPLFPLTFHRLFILCGLCIMLNGCANMLAPTYDEITIKTEPEGAKVYDENGWKLLGITPLTHSFRRAPSPPVLVLSMAGRKSQELTLERTMEKLSLLNFAPLLALSENPFLNMSVTATTVAGSIVDTFTGKVFKYAPNTYMVVLEKERTGGDSGKQTYLQRLRFVLINHSELIIDIAHGDGKYLQAYFEMRVSELYDCDYQLFLASVLLQTKYLLATQDSLDFFHELEKPPGLTATCSTSPAQSDLLVGSR